MTNVTFSVETQSSVSLWGEELKTIKRKSAHIGQLLSGEELKTSAQWRIEGGLNPPPQNSEVLTKLSRIPSSVENTYVTT
jgi:hypothetical protein